MNCTRNCNQGRACTCFSVQMYGTEGTLSEPIRRVNVLAALSWTGVATAILAGLAVAAYGLWLS